jgi:hypothetical protein
MRSPEQLAGKAAPVRLGKSYPVLDKIAVVVGMMLFVIGSGMWIYMSARSHVVVRPPGITPMTKRTPTPPAQAVHWLPPQGVVLTLISADHYKADDGTLIITDGCLEPAEDVTAILQYDARAPETDDVVSFPSGAACRVVHVK